MSPSSQLPSDRDPKAPQASPDPDVSTDPPAPDDAGAAAAGPNPAKKVALIVAVVVVVLMTWYVLTDRHAPYTSRGTVSTWVTLIGPRVGGQVGEVFVHDNQQVRQGTPLFALDPRPFEVAAMKQMHRRMLLEWLQIDPAARPDAAGRGTNPPEGDDASG